MDPTLLRDIWQARRLLAGHLPATPAWSYPTLDAAVGATVYVKHENSQPVGAFKVRGGLTLLAGTTPDERRRGLITYSTGNHAQSLAYACRHYGAPYTVVMPAGASELKSQAVRALGGTVVLHGENMADAQTEAERLAAAEGRRLVSPGDEPTLLAGVGTLYLELFESVPDLDAVVVPVGSGTGAAAACVVAAAMAPDCRIVAVQSIGAPAAYESWRSGECVRRPIRTAVDGLATGRGYELPQRFMRAGLADFLLVSDADIATAQRLMATHAHTLVEGAGAAALAAALAHRDEFAGQKVAIICTGGNASHAELAALASGHAHGVPLPRTRPAPRLASR
jgi:threonine dehydratase